jgi:carbonic anhydrase
MPFKPQGKSAMNRILRHAARACAALAAGQAATAQTHWSCEGGAGPAHCGKLAPQFVMCAMGRDQSPIDLA